MPDYSGVSNEDMFENVKKPLMSKSDRQREIAPMSTQTVKGLCEAGRKCIRRNGHADQCWPL